MKKSAVNQYPSHTPEYVIMHARYQRSRGRGLAASFQGIRNPQRALAAAQQEFLRNLLVSGMVSGPPVKLVRAANVLNRELSIPFNDLTLTALPGDSVKKVFDQWKKDYDAAEAEYLASPEHQERARRNQAEVAELQAVVDTAMVQLETLNLSDLGQVLEWIQGMIEPCDRVGVKVDCDTIIRKLEGAGYREGEGVGDDFDAQDKVQVARYLIGQSIAGWRVGLGPRHIILNWVEEWQQKA